jgi:Signal transduction histidine kinase
MSDQNRIRVFNIDDHPLLNEGITAIINSQPDMQLVAFSPGGYDLEQAFSRIEQDLAIEEPVDFRVIVEGRPRSLHPDIGDEVYRIGHEALVNAFRHSEAKSIEVELEYAAKQLRLVVRDNGCGIDPQFLHKGREGHWGLSGMRERAERIGARLKVLSRAGAGTEVELSVPNPVAFQHQSSPRPLGWLARLQPRKTGTVHLKPSEVTQ